jgi:N-acetylglutamate synthase-like GNAT family acetyltransferase
MLIRKGRESDRQALYNLFTHYDMQSDTSPAEFLIAEESTKLLGAARLERIGADVFLRSVAVDPAYHGRGIGSRLVRELIKDQEQVKVVARGYSAAFYSSLGFQPVKWNVIHPDIVKECEECSDFQSCQPVPMAFTRRAAG